MALIDSRMLYDAIHKTGNFEFLDIDYRSLRVLTALYDVPITLIAGGNTGIYTLEDLKDKRINIGAPLSAQRLSFDMILAAKRWSDKHFKLVSEISNSQGQDAMAFCHGTVDAMIHIGVHPDPSLRQLFRLCRAKAVHMSDKGIDGLIARHPAFSKFIIPPGTYLTQTKEIETFATKVFLVASESLDDDTAYQILGAIFKNRKIFSNAHPSLVLNKPDIKRMTLANLKLHTGAIKYFSVE
jgi:TRAP transporter TAXI family solute receptor